MQMLNGKIALEVEKKAAAKAGGLFVIPEQTDTAAIVKLIAEEVKLVKVGDKVFYGSDYRPLKVKGVEYLIMDEDNIIAVESSDVERENV